ncbi:outer membrane protein assembly factor BamE [Deltaproteobacteria bacterium TL4]
MRKNHLVRYGFIGSLLAMTLLFALFVPYNMIRYQYDFSNAFDRVLFYPLENTEWAPDFSEENFSKIRVGMTKKEVLTVLGEPLVRSCECQVWKYVWGKRRNDFLTRAVVYGRYGKVREVVSKFHFEASEVALGFTEDKFAKIHPGMTKDEVLSILGKPLLLTEPSSYWGYARKKSSDHFARRDLVFHEWGVRDIRRRYDFEDTEWAPEFSEESFSKIRIGMTQEEVLGIMGEPLIKTDDTAEYWSYWAYTWDKERHDDWRDRRTIYFDIHDTVDRVDRSFQ